MAPYRIPYEAQASAESSRLLADNDRLRYLLREQYGAVDLAGGSRAIRRVCELIAQIAPSSQSVCLRGEVGAGKMRAARAIHARSSRATGPFVAVTCAAMPDASVDAQLFGIESASPDGSAAGCVGRAAGGTLFLDEIGSLGPVGQARLGRLAQEQTSRRRNGVPVGADVRLIASSSLAIDELVVSGGFRQDLWEHVSALTIGVPPLRDRKVDLPLLTDLFVEHFARAHVRGVSRVSGRAMDMLMNYDWPGNVGELRRTIERAVVMTTGPVIHHHHLPAGIQAAGESLTAPAPGLADALEMYEKELLQDALKRARGVRSQAARLLMTSERVFNYRLRKHGIDSRPFKA
jgi:Nif-specific regulatory protein